jgi:hypothetical protein
MGRAGSGASAALALSAPLRGRRDARVRWRCLPARVTTAAQEWVAEAVVRRRQERAVTTEPRAGISRGSALRER